METGEVIAFIIGFATGLIMAFFAFGIFVLLLPTQAEEEEEE